MIKELSTNYKEQNNIDKNNVLNIVGNINATSYKSKSMYYEQIDDNVKKYYVSGVLKEEEFDDNMNIISESSKDYYLIIYINNKNNTFSVEPYDGKIFMSGDIDEK